MWRNFAVTTMSCWILERDSFVAAFNALYDHQVGHDERCDLNRVLVNEVYGSVPFGPYCRAVISVPFYGQKAELIKNASFFLTKPH